MKQFIHARVSAGARREAFQEMKNGTLRIAVKEKAERNAANARVRTLIALHLGVAEKSLRLIKGRHLASKTFQVIQ